MNQIEDLTTTLTSQQNMEFPFNISVESQRPNNAE